MHKELLKLLSQPPKTIKNNNGGDFIPIEVVEAELDEVFESWNATWVQPPTLIAPNILSCAIDLYMWYDSRPITRSGTGMDIVMLDVNGNPTPDSIIWGGKRIKSIAIANAAKTLGKRFGRYLNRKREHDTAQHHKKIINK